MFMTYNMFLSIIFITIIPRSTSNGGYPKLDPDQMREYRGWLGVAFNLETLRLYFT